jgi:hypothetical protein
MADALVSRALRARARARDAACDQRGDSWRQLPARGLFVNFPRRARGQSCALGEQVSAESGKGSRGSRVPCM